MSTHRTPAQAAPNASAASEARDPPWENVHGTIARACPMVSILRILKPAEIAPGEQGAGARAGTRTGKCPHPLVKFSYRAKPTISKSQNSGQKSREQSGEPQRRSFVRRVTCVLYARWNEIVKRTIERRGAFFGIRDTTFAGIAWRISQTKRRNGCQYLGHRLEPLASDAESAELAMQPALKLHGRLLVLAVYVPDKTKLYRRRGPQCFKAFADIPRDANLDRTVISCLDEINVVDHCCTSANIVA